MLPPEIIRTKRDGGTLSQAQIESFAQGLSANTWSDGQAAAMAMAILLRGMNAAEITWLTRAMAHSGEVLDWSADALPGPVLDKHSTGGVGDKVSLMLAPMVAACGAVVPMVSGRGLGHTGGTLDKLESLPGYRVEVTREELAATLRNAGCAIVGANANWAPADRRLYAIRDVTATVESVPLITASILSKKLAAGLQGLVLDVKVGNGAFTQSLADARALASSMVTVARGCGLPASALLTDMNQVLGWSAGNALEMQEALDFLSGKAREPRLLEVTLALGAEMLVMGAVCADLPLARQRLLATLDSGAAAERFARMVARLGGPVDVFGTWSAPAAPLQRPLLAARAGVLATSDTRAIGLALIALGAGRQHPADRIDPRVGLSHMLPLGTVVSAGQALALLHAATDAQADAAVRAMQTALHIEDNASAWPPLIVEQLG